MVHAQDDRPVNPNRIRKSIGAERTFAEDLKNLEQMLERIDPIIDRVFEYMTKKNNFGRTLTVKMKSPDFQVFSRSKSFEQEVQELATIRNCVHVLLKENWEEVGAVRLLGVTVSNLRKEHGGEGVQLTFDF